VSNEIIKIPDVGSDQVEVIEICVSVGDEVAAEDSLVVLESDKASMEVPSPKAGKVLAILVASGQSVGQGDDLIELDVRSGGDVSAKEASAGPPAVSDQASSVSEAPVEEILAEESGSANSDSAGKPQSQTVWVPDIGTEDAVEVIEVCIGEGDDVSEGDSLIVLESDKASMEIPAPFAGKVESLALKVGDSAKQGDRILVMLTPALNKPPAAVESKPDTLADKTPIESAEPLVSADQAPVKNVPAVAGAGTDVYAGPAVRKLAREFSIDLNAVSGSGPKSRILKEDLQSYVKNLVGRKPAASASGSGIPVVAEVDYSVFGEIEKEPLSKLHKLTATNMHRSWLNVPHVTQFDDADITELEIFRKSLKADAEKKGVKMTPLPFLLKACAAALRANPQFNAALADSGESIVYKQYVHIGIAVATPAGLMVPVVRDVDKKSLWELAAETAELAAKAKERKLKPQEMQGGCFTISSLGSIGGQGFTPIVNTPELAILGVSKLTTKPVWDGSQFVPREMLPLSLSYDHRAINGADAGKFFTFLAEALSDIRKLLL
jgi:pyruvate dehydrogenase E2 component (dihydrolipoamide acetyltransferase)